MPKAPPIEFIDARTNLPREGEFAHLEDVIRDLGGLDSFALSPEGRAYARRTLGAINDLAADISHKLVTRRCPVVLRGLASRALSMGQLRTVLVLLGSCLGTPTSTDKVERRVVWDVTPRTILAHKGKPTITERPGGAEPHTDSSYKIFPEALVMFLVLRAAGDGGGATILLDGRALRESLEQSPAYRGTIEILSSVELPFRVPTSFTRARREDEPECVVARVLEEDGSIRYRRDRIDEGLLLNPACGTKQVRAALARFDALVQSRVFAPLRLTEGELIVIDNREWLHGRTTFSDTTRHLLRTRVEIDSRVNNALHPTAHAEARPVQV